MATVLCKSVRNENISRGHRIGKLGLRLVNNHDSANFELPIVHLLYYGHVGILFEPLQVSTSFTALIDLNTTTKLSFL